MAGHERMLARQSPKRVVLDHGTGRPRTARRLVYSPGNTSRCPWLRYRRHGGRAGAESTNAARGTRSGGMRTDGKETRQTTPSRLGREPLHRMQDTRRAARAVVHQKSRSHERPPRRRARDGSTNVVLRVSYGRPAPLTAQRLHMEVDASPGSKSTRRGASSHSPRFRHCDV